MGTPEGIISSNRYPKVLIAMPANTEASLLPPDLHARLAAVAQVDPARLRHSFDEPEAADALARAEVLLTGWGTPQITLQTLTRAPRLHTIVHTAGTVRTFIDREVIRTITVCSQAQANAVPVAEFSFAAIVLAAKKAFLLRERLRERRSGRDLIGLGTYGTFGTTVGIIGASRVGRLVLARLRSLDIRTLLYDPYLDPAEAAGHGATSVGLEGLMSASQVVSLHAPLLPSTLGMITRDLLSAMPDGATFINTARGALVDHAALTDECSSGRLSAVLDVTDPEPLPADSPLFELDNVFLTPHISGSLGNEVIRLGEAAVAEIARLSRGEALRTIVEPRLLERLA